MNPKNDYVERIWKLIEKKKGEGNGKEGRKSPCNNKARAKSSSLEN